jgi:hypothetical protein
MAIAYAFGRRNKKQCRRTFLVRHYISKAVSDCDIFILYYAFFYITGRHKMDKNNRNCNSPETRDGNRKAIDSFFGGIHAPEFLLLIAKKRWDHLYCGKVNPRL